MIVKQRPPTAKGVTFCTLEDEFGFIDLVIHADVYKKFNAVFSEECFVVISGILQKDGYSASVLVKTARPIRIQTDHEALKIEPTQYFFR